MRGCVRSVVRGPVALVCAAAMAATVLAQAPSRLKVHISVDMEGVAGVVSGTQLAPGEPDYDRFREFMTREAVAAAVGAKEAGATEVVVADAHGNGENLFVEQFPPDVRLVRGQPRPLSMMGGIDDTFDAAIFIAYHASTNNPAGVRAHTFSSATLTRVALNGAEVTEGAWNAAIAGHFGVPVVFVSGDDVAVAEVRKTVGDVEGVEVKKSLGFHSALTMTPAAAAELIGQRVKAALARRAQRKPYIVSSPVVVDVSFKHYRQAEVAAYLPGIERTDAHSIRFRARDMVDASKTMTFLTTYRPELTP